MPVKLGSSDIDDFKIGSSQVDRVYLGATLLWQKATPPVWSAIPNQSLSSGSSINLNLNTYVSGTSPITITVSGLPRGLSASNGVITGRSTVSGTHTITAAATNAAGTVNTTFTITVVSLPRITSSCRNADSGFPFIQFSAQVINLPAGHRVISMTIVVRGSNGETYTAGSSNSAAVSGMASTSPDTGVSCTVTSVSATIQRPDNTRYTIS